MILARAAPDEGHTLLQAVLRRAVIHDLDVAACRIGQPLPLFRMTAYAAAREHPLNYARHVGWRYPLLRGEDYGVACLLVRSKHLVFASINWQSFARRFFFAAELAENVLAPTAIKYEPRLLEIPVLNMFVLWLFARGKKSRFVVLKSPHTDSVGELLLEDNINPHFFQALSKRRRKNGLTAIFPAIIDSRETG